MNREIGRRYGHLTVVEDTGRRYHGSIIFKCVCDCGNFKDVSSNKLHSGHVISCGCVNHRIRDLNGQRFGRLTVVSFKGRINHKTLWNCVCDCGNACVASTASLTTGSTTSCGCRNKENQASMDGIRTGFVDGTYQVVVSDMTAFWAAGRYWELTLYTDLWNDEIVGWSLSSRKGDVSTYFEGLAEFLANKKEKYMGLETIFHTDQGSVYSSKAYNDILQPYGITRSMSRPGTPTTGRWRP